MSDSLSRHELVKLVERIINEGPYVGALCSEWLSMLEDNVPDPNVSDYIYWPDGEMTPEEIVDRALAYKIPILPEE